jgi:4-hydroxy-4-methyl-2-oxoglutarate aldolase
MKRTNILAACVLSAICLNAQVHMFTKEQMMQYTAKNPYGRFEDGRPKVPDEVLERMKTLSVEEIWGILQNTGYKNTFEGNFQQLHSGIKLIGRAVTAQFMPAREDVQEVEDAGAKARGWMPSQHQRVIDLLQPGDVLVADLFSKIDGGTIVGDNLAAAVLSATGNGFVVDGAIRDLEGIYPMKMNIYYRGVHPSAVRDVMLTGLNVPVRIGGAVVMPGDIVFGDRTGVYFVPPHLAEQILKRAKETHIHDEWTKDKFTKGRYKSTDLYPTPKDQKLRDEYEEYKKKRMGGN